MDLPQLPVIKMERVTDSVHRELRDLIVSGRIEAGHKLTTEDLASRFDVSRTPVHEALVLLASEGLVEIVPRKGTFVTGLSLVDIAETMSVRRALEILACESAVNRAAHDDLAVLRRLAAEIEATGVEGTDADATSAEGANVQRTSADATGTDTRQPESEHGARNLAFHQTLVELAGNRVLIEMYQRLNAHMKMARAHIHTWRNRLGQERAEHDAIVDALAKRDLEGLKNAVDRHLRRSAHSLITDLQAAQQRPPQP